MSAQITTLIDASFVLAVTGAAMLGCVLFGPAGSGLALLVGAAYLGVQAFLADRRAA